MGGHAKSVGAEKKATKVEMKDGAVQAQEEDLEEDYESFNDSFNDGEQDAINRENFEILADLLDLDDMIEDDDFRVDAEIDELAAKKAVRTGDDDHHDMD